MGSQRAAARSTLHGQTDAHVSTKITQFTVASSYVEARQ